MNLEQMKEELRKKAYSKGVPSNTAETIINWIAHGYTPGGFVSSVLKNNLVQSFSKADDLNLVAMNNIVSFLYNDCPGGCWGNEACLEYWKPWEQSLFKGEK